MTVWDEETLMQKYIKEYGVLPTDGWALSLQEAFAAGRRAGLREGIEMYAHWKDGVQYVGTCGRTLESALADIDKPEEG